ncbi:hypothetical protein GCM10010116_04020 [Microbispora rosea subsp. aerata]|nr:hypothetical protein GCM10010116_04020 [Microbispora rosea subsp. aerata]GIH54697.1 hypothetical protein Mro02_16110 [Microbispora rosea subsp. aerata]GLJ85780.1 hypothetical protein GCM10017588_45130 [Microbispora rosea subsp. aerata]
MSPSPALRQAAGLTSTTDESRSRAASPQTRRTTARTEHARRHPRRANHPRSSRLKGRTARHRERQHTQDEEAGIHQPVGAASDVVAANDVIRDGAYQLRNGSPFVTVRGRIVMSSNRFRERRAPE